MPSNPLKKPIPPEYAGWWRIVDTETWVTAKATKAGISSLWSGAWEYEQVSGSGTARLGKDGRLHGRIKITDGDDSTFIAERSPPPKRPIPEPPSYGDKWRR